MKAQIITLSPGKAKELLMKNNGNRKRNQNHIDFLAFQMLEGTWKENGESIIIDTEGVIKDGQHRLCACIEADYTFSVPLITGVAPAVMDTIDTGKNRSLSDILSMQGINNANNIAAITKMIMLHEANLKVSSSHSNSSTSKGRRKISNNAALQYVLDNETYLAKLTTQAGTLYKKQIVKALNSTSIGLFLHILNPYKGRNIIVTNYIEQLTGINCSNGTGVDYFRQKLQSHKIKKLPLNFYYILGMTIKGWNLYLEGNSPVAYMKYDIKDRLPKVKDISKFEG